MSPLILASQSQALPLLFLPLALSGGHSGVGLKRVHANTHAQVVSAQPMLFPVNAVTCTAAEGDGRLSGGRYIVDLDPRFGLNTGAPR
jgi:hypothetical protein